MLWLCSITSDWLNRVNDYLNNKNMLPVSIETILKNEIDPGFAKRARAIFTVVEALQPKKVLDAGCGRGFYVQGLTFFPFVKEIHGIDLNVQYLLRARKNIKDNRVKVRQGSLYQLPFANNTFDLVICSEVLEHLDRDDQAVREIYRVLKPGGSAVFSVPHANYPLLWDPINWILERVFNTHISKDIWWLAGIWADHVRLYTPEQFRQTVTDGKLRIVKQHSFVHWSWPFSHFLLYGIGKNLVERFGAVSFDRFTAQAKPLAQLLGKIMAWPSSFDPANMENVSSIDLFIHAQKPQATSEKSSPADGHTR